MHPDEFIDQINRKQMPAFRELFGTFYRYLVLYALRYVKQQEVSEDVVQEVFIAVWRSEKRFDSVQDLTRYLYRACYNNALVFVRNNQIHDTILNSIGAESDFTADDVTCMLKRFGRR